MRTIILTTFNEDGEFLFFSVDILVDDSSFDREYNFDMKRF